MVVLDKVGLTQFWGKIKAMFATKDEVASKADSTHTHISADCKTPILSKTYTNVLRVNANYTSPYTASYLYFGNIKPTDLTKPSMVRYHVYAYGTNSNYLLDSIVEWHFSTNGIYKAYYIFNNLNSTSYYPFAYHTLYYSRTTAVSQSDGSYFGCYYGTSNSYGQSASTIARTIQVEILECENCTVALTNNVVWFNNTSSMPANLVATSAEEAYNTTKFSAVNVSSAAGLQETGDANSNTIPTGYCTTRASTAAKSASCTYGYRDDTNYFPCLFRYANTATNATLSIASYATNNLPIYVNGARTSASNTFGAGVIMFLFYNNAYYCYNDGRFPILYNGAVTSLQDVLGNTQSRLTFDTTPTENSTNPVTSGGVYSVLGDIQTALDTILGTSVTLITFTINGESYQAEEGMTWTEWCESSYNTSADGWRVDGSYIVNAQRAATIENVRPSDTITNSAYVSGGGGGSND